MMATDQISPAPNGAPRVESLTTTAQKPFVAQAQKIQAQQKELLETLACDCGNTIRMFNRKHSVKCFGCNFEYMRVNGKWEKQPFPLNKDAFCFGDLLRAKDTPRGIVFREKPVLIEKEV